MEYNKEKAQGGSPMESYTYPAALGGLYFSANRALLRIVPVSVHTVENQHRGTTHSHDFLQFWYTISGSWYHTANGITTKQGPGSAAAQGRHRSL